MKKLYFVFLLFIIFHIKLKATHGLPLVNLNYTISATGITISAEADPASCGAGPYWMQVEVACSQSMTATPPTTMQATLASWTSSLTTFDSHPWYNSLLNIPGYSASTSWSDGCVGGEVYHDIYIPFTNFIPGTTIYFAAREWVSGSNSAGPFSPSYSVTIPGTLPTPISFSLSTSAYSLCPSNTATLSVINLLGGPVANYSWTPSIGSNSVEIVSPTVSTSYTVSAENGFCNSHSQSVSITVIQTQPSNFIPTNPIICNSDNIIFSAIGGSVLATHAWGISPNIGYTINNSTVTPTPNINFDSTGVYVVTHTTNTQGCINTSTTNVVVNLCIGIREYEDFNISIYPNPSLDGKFNIQLNNIKNKNIKIELFDVLGKLILSQYTLLNDSIIIPYIKGIYSLKISDDKIMCKYQKLVIE